MDSFLETVGWAGTGAIVLAYFLLSRGRLKADSFSYHVLNFFGAVAVGASVFFKQAWPALALEIVWAAIALMALVRLFRSTPRG